MGEVRGSIPRESIFLLFVRVSSPRFSCFLLLKYVRGSYCRLYFCRATFCSFGCRVCISSSATSSGIHLERRSKVGLSPSFSYAESVEGWDIRPDDSIDWKDDLSIAFGILSVYLGDFQCAGVHILQGPSLLSLVGENIMLCKHTLIATVPLCSPPSARAYRLVPQLGQKA